MAGIPDSLKGRSYTRVSDWSRDELELALDLADELKQERLRRKELRVLPGRTIGMIFHKPSTRTRVGFEVGIAELGGMALYLPAADLQLARGESYRDTALVLSRFVSALLIRTFDQAEVDTFAEYASIPVINGLTDLAHPLQALADAMTIRERLGGLEGVRITYLGDGNNVCHSLMRLAARFGMHFTAACPAGYEPSATVTTAARADATASGGSVRLTTDPLEGSDAADVLYTECGQAWVRRTSASSGSSTSSASASTANFYRSRAVRRWLCTACRRTSGRRLPRTCCTGRDLSCGIRRRTACIPRRRSWRS